MKAKKRTKKQKPSGILLGGCHGNDIDPVSHIDSRRLWKRNEVVIKQRAKGRHMK